MLRFAIGIRLLVISSLAACASTRAPQLSQLAERHTVEEQTRPLEHEERRKKQEAETVGVTNTSDARPVYETSADNTVEAQMDDRPRVLRYSKPNFSLASDVELLSENQPRAEPPSQIDPSGTPAPQAGSSIHPGLAMLIGAAWVTLFALYFVFVHDFSTAVRSH
jgi:hypothetical protein